MNVKLLRKVAKHILAEPKRLTMDAFVMRKEDENSSDFCNDGGQTLRFPKCGTTACIAGWACLVSGQLRISYGQIRTRAIELLDIDDVQAGHVFYVDNWPDSIARDYRRARTQPTRAKIVANRIEHFIETGE